MSFWKTLSEKLGFMSGESDERDEDELEDGEIQDEDYDDEEEDESRSSFRFSLNNPFNKNKKQTSSPSSRRNTGEEMRKRMRTTKMTREKLRVRHVPPDAAAM